MTGSPTERVWTEAELAERWGLSPLTLRRWRCEGAGPEYFKAGRNALYRDSAVARWEAGRPRGPAESRSVPPGRNRG